MPLRVDSRQQARLQKVPILPGLPPEPSLESAYTGNKTDGLTRVFQIYDRARKEWAAKVAQHLGRMQDAILAIGSSRGAAPVYPNRGWASLRQTGEALEGNASTVLRPDSASITITPYWADSVELAQEREEAAQTGTVAPSDTSVLVGVRVAVSSDTAETGFSGRGTLRVTLVPAYNSERNVADQVRVLHVSYSLADDWTQFHYFEPFSRSDPYPNPVYWKDLEIQGVYAELV